MREQGGGPRETLFDDIIIETNEDLITNALQKKNIKSVHRKGKYIYCILSPGDDALLIHFGMTGSLVVSNEAIPQYKSFKVSEECWPPKFTKCELVFENGKRLAYCDPRRLGRIRVLQNPLACPPISHLALDPTLDVLTARYTFLSYHKAINLF